MRKLIAKKTQMLILNWVLISSLLVGLIPDGLVSANEAAAATPVVKELNSNKLKDIAGHWAEPQLTEWSDRGLIDGYEDGTFRPDQIISRIEFVTLVNRLFAFKDIGDIQFSDVPSVAWFASQVKAAKAAGYIQGYADGTFHPDQRLLRVEASTMLSLLVPMLVEEGTNPLSAFKDQASVPDYGRVSLNAAIEAGYINGFPDQTVRPMQAVTRAEAIVILDRILKQSSPNAGDGVTVGAKFLVSAGIYGPKTEVVKVAGDLTLNAPGTSLQNLVIKGNLLISKSVGEGDVYLDNVTVLGKTVINGGGENSIHIDNSQLGSVVIEKIGGRVRVVSGGSTVIEQMDIQSDAQVESNGTTGSSIKGIVISSTGKVTLSGAFSNVEIKGGVHLTVSSGTIESLLVGENVAPPTITLNSGVKVASMEFHSASSVEGEGTVGKAVVDAAGVVFQTVPNNVEKTERGGATPTPSTGPIVFAPPLSPGTSTGDSSPTTVATVTPSVSQANAAGFRLAFNSAVPGLGFSQITLRNDANEIVAIAAAPATLDGGNSYHITASLTQGATYKVFLVKAGYNFGAAVTFVVPLPDIAVTPSVYGTPSVAGFTIKLSSQVAGLTAENLALKQVGTHAVVGIAGAATADGGTSYAVMASLAAGATYSLTVTKAGYSFGEAVTVYVPITDLDTIPVTATVYAINTAGFKVLLSEPVSGLTASSFTLTPNDSSTPIAISSAVSEDGGKSYAVTGGLTSGTKYSLTMVKTGYSFGAALTVEVPGILTVTATASDVRTFGFILSLNKPVPSLDPLSLVLKNSSNQAVVAIYMLSTDERGTKYEVWTSLDKAGAYTLNLDLEGYGFDKAVALTVEPEVMQAQVKWITDQGFRLNFDSEVSGLAAGQVALKNAAGATIAIDGVRLGEDGKSVVVSANLDNGADYQYRLETADNRVASGTASVPENITVSRYTTYESNDPASGIQVHFSIPVLGLTADNFDLTDGNGNPVAIDSISTADYGSSYWIKSRQMNNYSLIMGINKPGYDFSAAARLIHATLNRWNTPGSAYPQFFAGFNPRVPNVTAADFNVLNAAGHNVPVTNIYSENGGFVVSFDDVRGLGNLISVVRDGYDFGAPKTITTSASNTTVNPSYTGFTLVLNPAVAIDTNYGFRLNKDDGSAVAIQSVTSADNGESYRIAANLTPGVYNLTVAAAMDKTTYMVVVPMTTAISVDHVLNAGLNVNLSYPVEGLDSSQFVLVDKVSNNPVQIDSAATADNGHTYRLAASLAKGSYNLKLTGQSPAAGVDFEVLGTLVVNTTIANISGKGFDLAFGEGIAVADLLPDNIVIRNGQGNPLSGIALSTSDQGKTYHVKVDLASDQPYTVTLKKDYVSFGGSISLKVRLLTASMANVTYDGKLTLKFSPAFPEIENYLGLLVSDADKRTYTPGYFEPVDGGASYEVGFSGNDKLVPGTTYTIKLDKAGFAMSPLTFTLPSAISVTQATTSGLTVHFDKPIPNLDKKYFTVHGAQGETVQLVSATTVDSGANYVLKGVLAGGKFYTVQFKSDAAYQINTPVEFVVSKVITAAISKVTNRGFKLQFSEKVVDLKVNQLALRDMDGNPISVGQASLTAKDQGLTYEVSYVFDAGTGYTLDLNREEFKLAAPVSFNVPVSASIRLVGTVAGTSGTATDKIVIAINPDLQNLTKSNFALFDSKGSPVDFSVSYQGGTIYNLTGAFNPAETYSLTASYPGYSFETPLTIGLQVFVDAVATLQTQKGFKIWLLPSISDLDKTGITVKDDSGNTIPVQSIQTSDFGATYMVNMLVPLTGGKTYNVSFAKKGYSIRSLDPFSLNTRAAIITKLSVKGFTLNMGTAISMNYPEISLYDEQGNPISIQGLVSTDGGITYEAGANLRADVNYKLRINKMGYDFGGEIPIFVQSVTSSFDGMVDGNNNAFRMVFNKPFPNMRPSDFHIKRTVDDREISVLSAVYEDSVGKNYTIESSFWGGEKYTILPVKDGYDFGSPVEINVPVIVSTAVLRAGAGYADIGLNPSVPGLDASQFQIKDDLDNRLTALSAVTEDGGASYHVAASLSGGHTYKINLTQAGFDFGDKLSVALPSVIAAVIGAAKETGITVTLSPGVSGLDASSVTLKDSNGNTVDIGNLFEVNGGGSYTLTPVLTGGKTYTLTLAAAGYVFGSPLTAVIPVVVEKAYSDFSDKGLTIKLDLAVPGLNVSNFSLLDDQGGAVTVGAITTIDGGATYSIQTDLTQGKFYSLSMAKAGYDLGIGLPFFVPVAVAKTVGALTKKGFSFKLATAVPDLTASNITLLDSDGGHIPISSLTTTDGGYSYKATADLIEGNLYKLTVIREGYYFGSELELKAQPQQIISASNVFPSLFYLNFSIAVPDLDRNKVLVVNEEGHAFALDRSNFYDENTNNGNKGRSYMVKIPLEAGKIYTVTVDDPAHPVEAPLEVILPLDVNARVLSANKDGIQLKLDRDQLALQTEDVSILKEDGTAVSVIGVTDGDTAGSYKIQAFLAEGGTYKLILNKKRYSISISGGRSIYVPIIVAASIVNMNENGFTVSLTNPVANLNMTLLDKGYETYLGTVTTIDQGQTYQVAMNLPYNKEYKLRLGKSGYELGTDLTVNNKVDPPKLLSVISSQSGTQVILTFDKPFQPLPYNAPFAVKINGQWQNRVVAELDSADKTQIRLSWNGGLVINAGATASVAYSGVNRVIALNRTYLGVFSETSVANIATELGFVQSFATQYHAEFPAYTLHTQYGKSALETARLLRQGGFPVSKYARAVKREYQLDVRGLIQLFYDLNADGMTLFQALDSITYVSSLLYYELIGNLVAAGYKAEDFAIQLRNHGFQSKDVALGLKQAGVSAAEVAAMLRNAYNESTGKAVELLKLSYTAAQTAAAVQSAYGLADAATIQALAAGGVPVAEAASFIQTAYNVGATANAGLLAQAGYPVKAIGAALAQKYGFADLSAAVQAFQNAGFNLQDIYAIVSGLYAPQTSATALLETGFSAVEVSGAVNASGGSAFVIIYVLAQKGYAAKDIAIIVKNTWGAGSLSLSEAMLQFAQNGFDIDTRAGLLHDVYAADIPSALGALYPDSTQTQKENMFKSLIKAGYDSRELAAYFLKNVNRGNRSGTLSLLRLSGLTIGQALGVIHDVVIAEGSAFTLNDAMQVFYQSYDRYEAAEVMAALRSAFANDANIVVDSTALATEMAGITLWDKYTIAQALVKQMGLTLGQWVELERTGAFTRFGCPCELPTIVRDAQYLFAGATIESITVALSLSNLFTLDKIIDGTINFYPANDGRAKGLFYLTATLKNAGYPFTDVAAAFDNKNWSDWIAAFSKYGIAASDVAVYLKSKNLTIAQVVDRLNPYPLKDIALVLRSVYGQTQSEALSALSQYDAQDIGAAVAWAYGGDQITLWVRTLKDQGATAISAINTLAARYPSYWDSEQVGPALVKGGFTQDEVMQGLLIHSARRNNLRATIGLLQQLYSQQQVTISQLLTASASDTPQSGIDFLKRGGYKLADIARSLKDYYGLKAGEASYLLGAAYQNNLSDVLLALASIYGQTLTATISEALEAQGLNTLETGLPYVRGYGFPLADIVGVAKTHFGKTSGETAKLFSDQHLADNDILITAIAKAYGQSIEHTIHEMLKEKGITAYSMSTIQFVMQAHFSLATSVSLAKDEYGLSAGETLKGLIDSKLYSSNDIVSAVANIYGSTQNASIVNSLQANHLSSLEEAIPYLRQMRFSLKDIVRVGLDYYALTSSLTSGALITSQYFTRGDIETEVSYVYQQTLNETRLSILSGLGITDFAVAIPHLRSQSFTLLDLVMAAKSQTFLLSSGEAAKVLIGSNLFMYSDIIAAIAQVYGKPIQQSLTELLMNSGIATLEQAAPFLRQMGFSLQETIHAAKEYYGKSAEETTAILASMNLESLSIIQTIVSSVYNQTATLSVMDRIEASGLTDPALLISYLWNAGVPLLDIVRTLKEYYANSSVEAVSLLIGSQLFNIDIILLAINTIYGSGIDAKLIEALKAGGIATEGAFAQGLSKGGYRMEDIARALKNGFYQTAQESKVILTGLGIYQASAIESTLTRVYGEVDTPVNTMQFVLSSMGITTAEGSVTYMKQQNIPLTDIVQQLKESYKLGADEATVMLVPYYKSLDVGLAVTGAYYAGTNLGYLAQMIPPGSASSAQGVVNYMAGKFKVTDIVLAMKVIFSLDALTATDKVTGSSAAATAEQVREAVTEVYGADPLFAYLVRLKANGADATSVAAELNLRGLLDGESDYLVDTLAKLGYDKTSIIKARYIYFNVSRRNVGTFEEQAAQLVRLGFSTPANMAQTLLRNGYGNGAESVYKVLSIIHLGLPDASIKDIVLAMKDQGYNKIFILGALAGIRLDGVDVKTVYPAMNQLGLTAREAVQLLSQELPEDRLNALVQNGYDPYDYLRIMDRDGTTVKVLKASGISAKVIADAFFKSGTGFYSIAKYLYDGGFTSVSDVAGALIEARCPTVWVLGYMIGIGGWTLKDVAKGMLDSNLISLADLATAIMMESGNNIKMTYQIIKEISTKERQAYYDGLSTVERKILSNNEIAIIVTLSTLRSARLSLTDNALQLRNTEVLGWEKSAILLILAGFDLVDVLSTMWDVFRDEIGVAILKTMLGKTIATFLAKFNDYYKLGKLVYKIVTYVVKH